MGCGTVRLTICTASGNVIGVDHDFEMLELAQRRLVGPAVQSDADHLLFADGRFDMTMAVTMCEFTVSTEVTITEFARVTQPGASW